MKNNNTFTSENEKYPALTVNLNGPSRKKLVYWGSTHDFGALSLTEAQELIEVLQAIIADYPKEPTNEEILNELPVGSVVSNTGGTYVKAGDNWFGAVTGVNWTVNKNYDWANDYGPLVVKYRGDE